MKKSIVIIASVLILSLFFTACTSNKLVGRWERTEDSRGFEYIEFFDGNIYKSSHSNYEGGYSISGDRILLQGDLMDDITFTYRVSGNTLIFYNDEGEVSSVFKKK